MKAFEEAGYVSVAADAGSYVQVPSNAIVHVFIHGVSTMGPHASTCKVFWSKLLVFIALQLSYPPW